MAILLKKGAVVAGFFYGFIAQYMNGYEALLSAKLHTQPLKHKTPATYAGMC
jgi:hypothetical protein